MLYFWLLLYCSLFTTAQSKQSKGNAWVVWTTDLPLAHGHSKYMPTLSNGQLAITVFRPSIRQNCLYNGRDWTSHRARIPGFANFRLSFEGNKTFCKLHFDKGIFETIINNEDHIVNHKILVHRRFKRSIFNIVTYEAKETGNDVFYINISLDIGPNSVDINFGPTHIHKLGRNPLGISEVNYKCGQTKQVENSKYQKAKQSVCIAWTDPTGFIAAGQDKLIVKTYWTIVDQSIEGILEEVNDVIKHSAKEIIKSHIQAWKSIWKAGHVRIKEPFQLEQTVIASQFYLLSYLPFPQLSSRELPPFCGLSPGGLAYGGPMADYEGHNFWDTEIWMFPPILLLHPAAAKELLDYRLSRLGPAKDYAASTGWGGARFPWESALTGGEVCPAIAQTVRDNEQHISGDISFAVRQYLAVSGDRNWFSQKVKNNSGCDLVRDIAQFWVSRTQFNNQTGGFDIKNVMGPDEDHKNVDNNAFTNAVASLAIKLAHYLGLQGICQSVPNDWLRVAQNIEIPYDSEKDFHPEFSGYSPRTEIKQADAVLLGFPIMLNMSLSTRKNDLHIYEQAVRETGPAMTWSMHAIGHMELGESDLGEIFFEKSYQPHVTKPFYIWTENRQPNFGAVNFITGMGGFLQSIVHGYFGIRILPDKMIVNPRVPAKLGSIVIQGLNYHENVVDLVGTQQQTVVQVVELKNTMKILQENKVYLINEIATLKLGSGNFELYIAH